MAGPKFQVEKYEKFVAMLHERARSVPDLMNKLKIGQRTVYNWFALVREDGYELARVGYNPTKWRIVEGGFFLSRA